MIATLALRPDTRTRSGSDFANSTSMRWPAIRFVGYRTPSCGLWVTPSGVTKLTADLNLPAESTSAVARPSSELIARSFCQAATTNRNARTEIPVATIRIAILVRRRAFGVLTPIDVTVRPSKTVVVVASAGMSRDFEFTIVSVHTTADVHQALTSEDQWLARFATAEKTDGYELITHADGAFTVDISEEVGTSELPGFVKKVIKGKLLITRTDHWGPLVGDIADGTLAGGSSSVSARVEGTMALRPDGEGSILTVRGTSTVKIPLIGGKIESLIIDMIKDMVDRETRETVEWAQKKNEEEN